jgi:hypothetical protein
MTPLTNRIAELQAEVATLTRERDEARRDGESLADSIEDFIGSQGTAYEPDQYLMLCGVVRDYAARAADAASVAPSATISIHPAGSSHTTTTATDVLFPGAA